MISLRLVSGYRIDQSNNHSDKPAHFLGERLQEMTYEEIAVWLDTRARLLLSHHSEL